MHFCMQKYSTNTGLCTQIISMYIFRFAIPMNHVF